jgi:hypothetical protein
MMPTGRRLFWILNMGAFLVMTSGCASSQWTNIEDEIHREGTGLHQKFGQRVYGFQLKGEDPIEYKGYARVVDRDSLALWSEDMGRKLRGPGFAVATVDKLEVYQNNLGRTLLLCVGIVGLVIGVLAYGYSHTDMEWTTNE